MASARTSSVVSGRHAPGARRASLTAPMRVRTRRSTFSPTASHIRRTWRLRPSWMVMRNTPGPRRETRAGALRSPSPISTPSRRRRIAAGEGSASSAARYSFSTPWLGWVSSCASSPSLVITSSPSVR